MEEMQTTIDIQAKQINSLQVERDRIKVKYEKLEEDCQKLKLRLDMQEHCPNIVKNNIPEEHKYNRSLNDTERCCSVGFGTIKTEGSAESNKPLLKVTMEPESTKQQSQKHSVQALMKIIALCLLYRTSSKTSISQNSKNLQRVYSQMSQQTWKQVIQEAAQQLPKLKANNSDCLNQWWGPASQEWNPPKIAAAH